ncbi:MAG: hypothetical protein HYX67_07020 [Candidatus Melainabacteria bacterium]|nr:hypothetical protein [Candidatus Melainabacteria bacterium]
MNRLTLVSLSIIFQITALAATAQNSPTATYLELHKKELAAKSYADLLPLRSATSIAHDKPMSKEDMDFIFPMFKATLPKNITVTNEQIKGTSAILKATAKPETNNANTTETTVGEIELTLENGQWKIEHEKWDSKIVMK